MLSGYVEVHINYVQLANYTKLQLEPKLRDELSNGALVMCGGKFRMPLWWIGEEQTQAGSGDSICWPSCGRVSPPVAGVLGSQGAKIFFFVRTARRCVTAPRCCPMTPGTCGSGRSRQRSYRRADGRNQQVPTAW